MTKKELKVKEENQVAQVGPKVEGIDSSDIIIPKIIVAQSASDVCKNGDVRPGEIYESSEGTVLAGKDETIELVLINAKKLIYTFEDGEFKNIEPFYPGYIYNETTEEGKEIERQLCYSFITINYKDMQEGNPAFPYIVNFMKSNKQVGKKLTTAIFKMMKFGKDYSKRVLKLKTKLATFGKHSWFVWDIVPNNEDVDPKYHGEIDKWVKEVNTNTAVIQKEETEDIPF